MLQASLKNEPLQRVANRHLRDRIVTALGRLGEIVGTDAAAVAAYDPAAVKSRRLVPTFRPSASQLSSTRRVLAGLKAAQVIVGAGRRGRRTVYRLRKDDQLLNSLSLGEDFD
jgi:hypothetical protein